MNKFLVIFLFAALHAFSQVNIQWQQRFDTLNVTEQVKDMATDANGNIYVCGTGKGKLNGTFDYLVVKYNSAGTRIWKFYYDGGSLDDCRAVAVDANGYVYVTGWSEKVNSGIPSGNYNMVTVKIKPDGTQSGSAMIYDGNSALNDEGNDIAVDNNGNIYVTGASDGTSGKSDFVTVKYNSSGAQQWVNLYNSTSNLIDQSKKIALDAAGNVYVCGQSQTNKGFDIVTIKYSNAINGPEVWKNSYNNTTNSLPNKDGDDFPKDMQINSSGEVFITGYSLMKGTIDFDCITLKIPSTGISQLWVKFVGGTAGDQDRGNSLALDASGNVVVTGMVNNGSPGVQDLLTVKYNASGTEVWKNNYNGPSNNLDEGAAIGADANGNVYVTGYSYLTGQNNNFNTLKYLGTNGKLEWLTSYNGTGNGADNAVAINVDANQSIIIAGTSKGNGSLEDFVTISYCQLKTMAGKDTSICSGATITLNSSAVGATSFVWKDLQGNTIGNNASLTISPTVTTSYVVTTANASGCSDDDTVKVSVSPLPSVNISASPSTAVCKGDTITLTANSTNSFLWSTGSTAHSIKVAQTGTFNLTITDPNSCSSVSSIAVSVYNLPTINAGKDTGLCTSKSIVLCATGANTYNWTDGPLTTIDDTTKTCITISPTSGTVKYIVKGTDLHGCINYDTVNVKVYALPPIPTITLGANNYLLANSSLSGLSFQWYSFDLSQNTSTIIQGATAQTYLPTSNGNYVVEITNANGCSAVSSYFNYTYIGVQEYVNSLQFSLSPNPASNALSLVFDTEKGDKLRASIYAINGETVLGGINILKPLLKNSYTIEIDSLPAGLYLLELRDNQGRMTTKKFIKE